VLALLQPLLTSAPLDTLMHALHDPKTVLQQMKLDSAHLNAAVKRLQLPPRVASYYRHLRPSLPMLITARRAK
jgi:hypothetical protein